jgi:hypothetical protein
LNTLTRFPGLAFFLPLLTAFKHFKRGGKGEKQSTEGREKGIGIGCLQPFVRRAGFGCER